MVQFTQCESVTDRRFPFGIGIRRVIVPKKDEQPDKEAT